MPRTVMWVGAIMALAAAGNVQAQDGGLIQSPDLFVADNQTWSGAYGSLSYGWGEVQNATLDDEFSLSSTGLHLGYQRDLGRVVLGAEVSHTVIDVTSLSGAHNVTRVVGKAGYDVQMLMPYVTAGWASAKLVSDGTDSSMTYSLGADVAVRELITIGAEHTRFDFEDFNGGGSDISAGLSSLRVGYRF